MGGGSRSGAVSRGSLNSTKLSLADRPPSPARSTPRPQLDPLPQPPQPPQPPPGHLQPYHLLQHPFPPHHLMFRPPFPGYPPGFPQGFPPFPPHMMPFMGFPGHMGPLGPPPPQQLAAPRPPQPLGAGPAGAPSPLAFPPPQRPPPEPFHLSAEAAAEEGSAEAGQEDEEEEDIPVLDLSEGDEELEEPEHSAKDVSAKDVSEDDPAPKQPRSTIDELIEQEQRAHSPEPPKPRPRMSVVEVDGLRCEEELETSVEEVREAPASAPPSPSPAAGAECFSVRWAVFEEAIRERLREAGLQARKGGSVTCGLCLAVWPKSSGAKKPQTPLHSWLYIHLTGQRHSNALSSQRVWCSGCTGNVRLASAASHRRTKHKASGDNRFRVLNPEAAAKALLKLLHSAIPLAS